MEAKTAAEFQGIWSAAVAAGMAAGHAVAVRPMTVRGAHILVNGVAVSNEVYHVAEGVCGFAWVVIKPATSAFAKWLKANDHASKHWQGGLCHWVGEFNQSMTRKEAYAHAMVKVLAAAGVHCYADSRMD